MEEVFLWACRGRTTMQKPWRHCLPEALFLSRKKEASLTDMDIFRSPFSYFNNHSKVGNSISFDMSLSDVWKCQSFRVEQRLTPKNWPDLLNCTMPSSPLVHYFWWTKAIGQRLHIRVYKEKTDRREVRSQPNKKDHVLKLWIDTPPTPLLVLTHERMKDQICILTRYYYLNLTYPRSNTTR